MVNPEAVIILCDIVMKNIDRGALPVAKLALKDFQQQCEREQARTKGNYNITTLNAQQFQETLKTIILKMNEMIKDRNERFG